MNKKFLLLGTIILSMMSCIMGNIHKQDKIERKQNFDFNWKFALGDFPSASKYDFEDSGWRNLDLPHDWSIEGKIVQKNPTGGAGGYFPAGIGWYRKKFGTPPDWQGKRISIYFEGVYMNSEVFVNGKSLGIHPYGYTSFFYDLTPYLNYNKENIISVRVDNSKQMNSRWYSGSGIYRHVWLYVTEPIHIDNWGIDVTTPEINSEKAFTLIKTTIKNETSLPQHLTISALITDKKSKKVGYNKVGLDLPAGSQKEVIQTLNVKEPFLWSPETPNLYQVTVKVMQGKKVVDISNNTFGIRSIKFSPENGFQLNGKTVKLNGGCAHHDNGCLGAAAYDRAEERKVQLLKSAGFNSVRTSHNPPSEAFLNACDRLGLMVIDEAFDCWEESKNTYDYGRFFKDWWQRDIESMIYRDRNHPSVIIWSTGNEILERKKPEAVVIAKNLAGAIHKIDSTRPVTSAMTTWDKEWEMFDPLFAAHDIGGYNYQLDRAPSDHVRVPSRVIIQTESFPRDAFKNWNLVQNNSYILGDFVWTALDYLGESGIGRYYYPGETKGEHWEGDFFPWHGAYCGDIDLTGWRKPISHYRSILYNNTENIYMAVREPNPVNGEIHETMWSVWPTWESWTWPGYEGKDIQVDVYSKYPSVRLYLNDKLVEEKQTGKGQEFKTTFTLKYAPGLLKAVAIKDNKEVESTVLKTAGETTQIRILPDRKNIFADGQDLSFVTVNLTDNKGIVQPNAENQLTFSINGPGVIVGVDNANLKDLEQYVGSTRKAWHGRALVVIKSTKSTGNIKLRINSPELPTATLTISAKKP